MTTTLLPTPGQTVGPFFHYALPYEGDRDLVPPGSHGAIRLFGTVFDGAGTPVPDAILEVWQADPSGAIPRAEGSLRRDGLTFTGFGRATTDRRGVYSFSTLLPGPTSVGAAPFFAVTVFARGLLDRHLTRAYLPADAPGASQAALDADRLLSSLPPDRRATLLTEAVPGPTAPGYRFDVRLQGGDETVFLTFGER